MSARKQTKAHTKTTSWESVSPWYQNLVGEEGHYYHKTLIIPAALKWFEATKGANPAVLDLACGQGVLGRSFPADIDYLGIDLAPSFIKSAKTYDSTPKHQYMAGDAAKPLSLKNKQFSHALVVLALQNIEFPQIVFQNAYQHLKADGKLLIIMNHPCFRIPRQSSWKIDEQQKCQYRRIDRYFSSMQIPIQAHPSKGEKSPSSWTFHHPLSKYCLWLYEAGFNIEMIDEWCSNKVSTGKMAKMENRTRAEIPLFLAISAVKVDKPRAN